MAILKRAIRFARSVLNLCARVVHKDRMPTDEEIRGIGSRLLTANDSDFESVVREMKTVLWRRLDLPMGSYRHSDANRELFALRYVLRPEQRQPANQPDAGTSAKEQSKRREKSASVDDRARNERQKMSLLVEHRHILSDISKELVEDNLDLVARTKKLIAKSKKNIEKRKSA